MYIYVINVNKMTLLCFFQVLDVIYQTRMTQLFSSSPNGDQKKHLHQQGLLILPDEKNYRL